MSLPKPDGIENWTKQNALGQQMDSLRKSVNAAKAQTTGKTKPISRISEAHFVDSTAKLSLATPGRREMLEKWKLERKCPTPKRVVAPSTPEHAVARPSTPVLHCNKKLIRLHIRSTASSATAREELAEMIADASTEDSARALLTAMPEYWAARSQVEQRDSQWVRALEMLVVGHSRGAEPLQALRTEASAVLKKMAAWVAAERTAIVAARDAGDRETFTTRKKALQLAAGALKRLCSHQFCSPVLCKEAQLVIDAICVSLPQRARKQAHEEAPAPAVEPERDQAPILVVVPKGAASAQEAPQRALFTADQVAQALAEVRIGEPAPKSPATRFSASPADSPLAEPTTMDEEDWRSPESALAEESQTEASFRARPRARPEITPVRLGPTLVAPEIYTSKLATPVSRRGVPIMAEEDFKSPEPPQETDAIVVEAPVTPINANIGKKVRRRRSLVLKSPGFGFSAQPERVPASEEVLRAREEARKAKEAAALEFNCDMSCYEDFDDIEAPEDVKPSFGKLPQSFPVSAIPHVKLEHATLPERQQASKELQGSLVVITPARTTRKEREALGSERKLAAVRRSSRFLSSAASEHHPELVSVERPEEFDKVLKDYDYIYAPNPKLLTKKRPTQLLVDQMEALSLDGKKESEKDLSDAEVEEEDSMEDLDPMMREEMVEEPTTAADDEEAAAEAVSVSNAPTAPAAIAEDSGRFQEVIPVGRKQSKKVCLTPVVRSSRLAQKRLQKNK